MKQLGFHPDWSYEGRLYTLSLPKPFTGRPRLGSRQLIRDQMSKLIFPIVRELKDRIALSARFKAIQLLE